MKWMKRAAALFLCFLMLSSGPVSTFAQTNASGDDVFVEEETTTPAATEDATQPSTAATVPTDAAESCELCGSENCQSDHAGWRDTYPALSEEEKKAGLASVIGEDVMDAWLENETVSEDMMLWAMVTGGNQNVYLAEDNQLYFIYSGTARATLNEENNLIIDNCYNMAVAQLDQETGEIKALTTSRNALDGPTTIKTQSEYLEAADSVLLDAVMTFDSSSAFERAFENIEIQERNAFISRLSSDERSDAYEYLVGLSWENLNNYTNAASFVSASAASQGSSWMPFGLMRNTAPTAEENGLILNKTAVYNPSTNSAQIRLEAYVTGTVTTEMIEEDIPCDIVLVLDFSESMDALFATEDNPDATRRDALQVAVNNFIDSVYAKYQTGGAKHRISIVVYNSAENTRVEDDWLEVNSQGNVDKLKITDTEKENWQANGTQTHLALEKALGQLNGLPATDEARHRAVILFTDGFVSGGNAITCINNALAIKSIAGGCSVYTVAVYEGLDPTAEVELDDNIQRGDDDPAAGDYANRKRMEYMNATFHGMSSNYPTISAAENNSAHDMAVTNAAINPAVDTNGNGKFDSGEPGYYLVADSPENLNNIFQSIASNIQSGSASIELDSSTVVKDIVSEYFAMPTEVTVMTYDCLSYDEQTGAAEWDTAGTALRSPVTFDSANKAVNVTGFDFSKNFVSEEGRNEDDASLAGTFHGKKIVITFSAPVRNGFLGGNGVPTNGSAAGVYSANKLVEAFRQPVVDVPVPDLTVNAPDYHVYLLGGKTADQLREGITVTTSNGQAIRLDPAAANYGLAPWQNDYVNIESTVNGYTGLTADAQYTASVTFTPNTSGTYTEKSGMDTGNICVYKPVVTYKDSTIDLGTAADYETQNFAHARWMHGTATAPTSMGAAPVLTCIYSPAEAAFTAETSVKASVKIGTTEVTQYVTFYRDACTYDGCSNKAQTTVSAMDANRVNFVVHIHIGDLTITKTGTEAIDESQSYLFHISGPNNFEMDVVLYGNGSVTIRDLPVGEYTVTENGDWSWRYDAKTGTITQRITSNEAENYETANFFHFVNTRENQFWLSGDSYCENWWGGENGTKVVKREEHE